MNNMMMNTVGQPVVNNFTYANTSQKPRTKNRPLNQLKPLSLGQLRLDEVHYGNYIQLRFIHPCFKQNAIIGICEDNTGRLTIEISIINFDLKGNHYDYYFSKDTVIYVKEPYYKVAKSGTIIIRIDNPKDIVFKNDPEARSLKGNELCSEER